jgi:phospholipid transport system substrate-binding protein
MTSRFVTLLSAMLLVLPVAEVYAAADPAVAQVQTLTAALLKSMQAGPGVSMTQRYRDLEPVIEQVFALPLVTRLAVGPDWATFSPEQQKALIAAFTRFTVANYVHNFHDFGGEKFQVDEQVTARDAEKIVRSRVIPPHDSPVNLLYRMRESQGAWKVVDVYSSGVSSLALRRSDFAAALARGGAPELLAYLNRTSEALLR